MTASIAGEAHIHAIRDPNHHLLPEHGCAVPTSEVYHERQPQHPRSLPWTPRVPPHQRDAAEINNAQVTLILCLFLLDRSLFHRCHDLNTTVHTRSLMMHVNKQRLPSWTTIRTTKRTRPTHLQVALLRRPRPRKRELKQHIAAPDDVRA